MAIDSKNLAPIVVLRGRNGSGKTAELNRVGRENPSYAKAPRDLDSPVHPGAKKNCSLLLRYLKPLTGLDEVPESPKEIEQLSRGTRSGLATLTGVDSLRRQKQVGGLLENPEEGLDRQAQEALGRYLAELWATKRFRVVVETHSIPLIEGLNAKESEGRLQPGDLHVEFMQKEGSA